MLVVGWLASRVGWITDLSFDEEDAEEVDVEEVPGGLGKGPEETGLPDRT
jgi:hypothetical protein